MCRRIIEYWEPCLHQRLLHTIPCDAARGTPGQSYEDCADGENSFLAEPSQPPCLVCWRREAFREYTRRENTRAAGSSVEQRQRESNLRDGKPARRSSLFPSTTTTSPRSFHDSPPSSLMQDKATRLSSDHTPSIRSSDIASTSVAQPCPIGQHDFVGIDENDLLCMKCGSIREGERPAYARSEPSDMPTPLVSFADDDDREVASTPHGGRSLHSSVDFEQQLTAEFNREATPGPVTHDGGPYSDAPTPASMTSDGRAEASWRLYGAAIGRPMPDW